MFTSEITLLIAKIHPLVIMFAMIWIVNYVNIDMPVTSLLHDNLAAYKLLGLWLFSLDTVNLYSVVFSLCYCWGESAYSNCFSVISLFSLAFLNIFLFISGDC